jgi:copper chaperone CopZ
MAAIMLDVQGMTCNHCQAKVAKALEQVNGVFAVSVDLAAGKAEVDAAPTTDVQGLVAAVKQAGYDARVAA